MVLCVCVVVCHTKFGTGRCIAVVPRKKIDYRLAYEVQYRVQRVQNSTVLYCTYRGKCHSTIKYWVCFQNVTKWQKWSSSAPLNEAITTNNVIKLYLIKRLSIKISTTRTNRPKMYQKTPSEFMENLNPV